MATEEGTPRKSDSGNYTQRALIVGRYRLRVEALGFKTFVQDNIGVSVDLENRVDVQMEVGEVTQMLDVTAEASVLKTERSDVATWTEKTVRNIPTLNRRFTNFQLMTPGVVSFPTRGPTFSQMDMSFFKSFAITERVRAQFRAESFNFLKR